MSELLYHGTTFSNIPGIFSFGLLADSCFASDPAFALSWRNETVIVLEKATALPFPLEGGMRITPWGFTCAQYRIPKGMSVSPSLLREASKEELARWQDEIALLERNKVRYFPLGVQLFKPSEKPDLNNFNDFTPPAG